MFSRTRLLLLAMLAVIPARVYAQTAAPTINNITPVGGERGKTITLTIEGINLAGAQRLLFSQSGLTGRVVSVEDLGEEKRQLPKGSTAAPIKDVARRFRVVAEVRIMPETPPGRHTFRLATSLGTTNSVPLAVGALPEIAEEKAHGDIAHAQRVDLPATIVGQIEAIGDRDYYRFEAKPGQELVFEVNAASLGSSIDARIDLLDVTGRVIASNDDYKGRPDPLLAYRFSI